MLKVLQQKLLASGYVTNTIHDKYVRYEISEILKKGIKTYGNNVMLVAVTRFVEIMEQRQGENIMKKVPYFKKLIEQTINEALLPENDFPEIELDDEAVLKTIIRIIEDAVFLVPEKEMYNPIKTLPYENSPWLDVPEELYKKAHREMVLNKKFFEPLIERALKITDSFEGSIKDEVNAIYEELEKFTTEDINSVIASLLNGSDN